MFKISKIIIFCLITLVITLIFTFSQVLADINIRDNLDFGRTYRIRFLPPPGGDDEPVTLGYFNQFPGVWKTISNYHIYNPNSGNVGIGTGNQNIPYEKLEVVGRMIVSDGRGANRRVILLDPPSQNRDYARLLAYYYGGTTGQNLILQDSGGNVGIGNITPTVKLDIDGQIRIRGGNPGAGKVLVSDANGIGSWQDAGVEYWQRTAAGRMAGYQTYFLHPRELHTGLLIGSNTDPYNPGIMVMNDFGSSLDATNNGTTVTWSHPYYTSEGGTNLPGSVAVRGWIINKGIGVMGVGGGFPGSTPLISYGVVGVGPLYGYGVYGENYAWFNGSNIGYAGYFLGGNGVKIAQKNYENEVYPHPMTLLQVMADAKAKSWQTFSSIRFKDNIRTINDSLEKINQLRGVYFTWKNSNKEDVGLLAEEVEKVLPQLVSYDFEGKPEAVAYERFIPLLIEAIKKQQEEIQLLQKQLLDIQNKK
jgi:hypothetical protein